MKWIPRDPVKHEIMDLFAAVGTEIGFPLTAGGQKKFLSAVKSSVKKHRLDKRLLYGKRTEQMFAYIAGALGKCALVQHTDAGKAATVNPEVRLPDYQIVTRDDNRFLVEVKNCYGDKLFLTSKYIKSITNYASLLRQDVKLAVYWCQLRLWTLTSIDKIPVHHGKYIFSMDEAAKKNEMSILGDVIIFPIDHPVTVHLFFDQDAPQTFEGTTARGKVKEVKIECSGKFVENEFEREVVMFFLTYGAWSMSDATGFLKDGRLEHGEIKYRLVDAPDDSYHLVAIGTLSGMYSVKYETLTGSGGGVTAFAPKLDPGELGVAIPPEFFGETFRFIKAAFGIEPEDESEVAIQPPR